MNASDFDYHLPKELIATYPLPTRDESRLLVLNKQEGKITHRNFFDITDYLVPGDLIVLNNTKVIPAKLVGKRDGEDTEALLTQRLSESVWRVMVIKPRPNQTVNFNADLSGKLMKDDKNEWIIEFDRDADLYIDKYGKMPLPPYIDRNSEDSDKKTYQTVYAKKEGAIAAHTAGLHFTKELLERIRDLCIDIRYITLHVGIGTSGQLKPKIYQTT